MDDSWDRARSKAPRAPDTARNHQQRCALVVAKTAGIRECLRVAEGLWTSFPEAPSRLDLSESEDTNSDTET